MEKTAGIILAAGESKRLGFPKQTYPWKGKPLVRHVTETALNAGLDPVIVVTGCYRQEVESALENLPVRLVHNPDWKSGQGKSISVGVQYLPQAVGSCFFILSDQPFISTRLLRGMIECHLTTRCPILLPFVRGQCSNPGLFDRETFIELLRLEGDIGGRALFSRFPVAEYPWEDGRLLLDMDDPADVDRLISEEAS
jgi:molybdenum cofactor cytidylyltransferase